MRAPPGAGIDGGIGLNEVRVRACTQGLTPEGADDALGNRLPKSKGVANGQDGVPDSERVWAQRRGA